MSTYLADIRTAILGRINANYAATDIVWPGVRYTPAAGTTAFTRFDVMMADAEQADLTAGLERVIGTLQAGIFGRQGSGTDEITQYADTVRDLFPNLLTLSAGSRSVRFRVPRAGGIIYEPDGEWMQIPVTCPFYLYTA